MPLACVAPALLAQTSYGSGSSGEAVMSTQENALGASNRRQPAEAQPRRVRPVEFQVSAEETFTTNVDLQPDAHSDFVTRIIPTVRLLHYGPRGNVQGTIAAPILLYANTGRNNRIEPDVGVQGHAELVEHWLYVDASAQARQSYLDPFGARSDTEVNNPRNAYTAQSYHVAPYVRGLLPADVQYEVRDNNTWNIASNSPVNLNNSYANEITATARRVVGLGGAAVDYRREDVQFGQQPNRISELGRVRLILHPDPQVETWVSGGYEHNRYPAQEYSNIIYGTGVRWRPSPRTHLDAEWEHRFFGSYYKVAYEQREPLAAWSLEASRDVQTYPQLLATLGAGDVASLLNTIFTSRVPDDAERAAFVERLIDERGLPTTLAGPLSLYTQQITVQQRVLATLALLGARNTVLFSAFRQRTRPIAGADVAASELEFIPSASNNTEVGGGVSWTHRLSPLASLLTGMDYSRTSADTGDLGSSRQSTVRSTLSYRLSPLTSVYGGARYRRLRSDLRDSFDEAAVFVGISHLFR